VASIADGGTLSWAGGDDGAGGGATTDLTAAATTRWTVAAWVPGGGGGAGHGVETCTRTVPGGAVTGRAAAAHPAVAIIVAAISGRMYAALTLT
jgi:hypothetical protein